MTASNIIVITGSGGMGRAVARRIGAGSTILLADVVPENLAAAADELRSEGLQILTQVADVSQVDSVAELVSAAESQGPIASVVHTAGLSPVQAPPAAIVNVDLLGSAHVLDAFGAVIGDGGAGVFVSSMAGTMASLSSEFEHRLATTPTDALLDLPELAPGALGDSGTAYVLAKRANQLRVRAAARVWGERGGRVNSVSPGIIATPMGEAELAGPTGDGMRAMITGSASRRIGTPHDIAAAVAFLVGTESSFVTGTDLLVDGGVVASLWTA